MKAKTERNLKVMTIIGTRPEIIRLSRTMALLDEHLHHVVVHTGQNYDYELNESFYEDLELRPPDHRLEIKTTSLGRMLGEILIRSEEVIVREQPDAILILGDTNSSLSAIVAKRYRIPVYHMEAGNRCFDQNVPEEINRRIIDHLADFNLVYTEHARRHLLAEGLPARRIYLTGSPLNEVLAHYSRKIDRSGILQRLGISPGEYFLVSTHREENVDRPESLQRIFTAVNRLAVGFNKTVIVSTHPRTRNRLQGVGGITLNDRVRLEKPFTFTDYVCLQKHALCTISDSGTVSEESAILSLPAIVMRNATERPEALDTGTTILAGMDPDTVADAVRLAIAERDGGSRRTPPSDYTITDTSWRVLKLITGTARLSNAWAGVVR